jgi:hypothetical protein
MAETVTVKRPIRGLLWGLLLGVGLAFVLVFSTIIEFALIPIVVVIVIGLVLGVLWGLFGPAKAPKGPPPPEHVQARVDAPPPSRFDDVTGSSTPLADAAGGPPEATA